MPHTNSILVIHPNGTAYAQRARGVRLVEQGRAYWRDIGQTTLVILSSSDDQANDGYEYGGKKSYCGRLTDDRYDSRSQTITSVPRETIDRTGVPVREPGGAKVMQLKPLHNRRTTGQHIPRPDRLFRTGTPTGRRDDSPAQVQEARSARKTRH